MDEIPQILVTEQEPDEPVPLALHTEPMDVAPAVLKTEVKPEESDKLSPPPLPLHSEPSPSKSADPVAATSNAPVPVPPPRPPSTSRSQPASAPRAAPRSATRSPPKFVSAHLRAPPPLTPMSAIAANGSVIGQYPPAPPGTVFERVRVPRSFTFAHDLPPAVDFGAAPPHPGSGMAPPLPPPQGIDFGAMPPPPPTPHYAIEYKCAPCRLVFNTKNELLRHKRVRHEQGADGGPVAAQRRQTRSRTPRGGGRVAMGAGAGGMGDGRRPRFYCAICNRSFSGKQHFEYHMRTHSGEKPFKCGTCGKAFRAKHSLKNHIRIHTGERPYQCKVCGKWFRQLGVMKNHIKNMHNH